MRGNGLFKWILASEILPWTPVRIYWSLWKSQTSSELHQRRLVAPTKRVSAVRIARISYI